MTRHVLAALAAFVPLLLVYELLVPGSLANAQYALGDAAFAQCIASTGDVFHCRSFGYPGGSTKPFGLPVSLLALVFGGVDGQVGLMDVRWAHITILAVAFWGACAFFGRIASSAWLGIAGALLYLVSPAVLLQSSYGALQLGMALLPAYLLVDASLLAAIQRGRAPRVALAVLLVAGVRTWALYLDGYSFLLSGLLAGCWLLACGLARREWLRTGMALVAYAFACGLATLVYRIYISGDALQGMPMAFFRAAGVDVMTLLLPPATHPLYGHFGIGHGVTAAMTWSDGSALMGTFIGYAALPAALVVGLAAWRGRSLPPGVVGVLVAGAVALVLSLGPSLKVGDYRPAGSSVAAYSMPAEAATATLPTARLYTSLPGISNARVLARWLVVTRLALVVLLVFAVAWLSKRKHGRLLAAALLAFAAIEVVPDLTKPLDNGRRVYAHAHWIYNNLSSDLARGTRQGEQVYIAAVHDGPGGNEYVVNTLCARADVRCYNAGGDKASIMVRQFWPVEILRAKQQQAVAANLSSALDKGLVDVVVVPYFDLRSTVYGLRQGDVRVDQVRERAEGLAEALGAGISHGAHFSFIRREGAGRGMALADAGDPPPPQAYRTGMVPVDELLATMPADPTRLLSIVPERLDGCLPPGSRSAVTVWWNASSHGVDSVELHVADRAGIKTKLWTSGRATGRRQTGEWIRDGSVIELRSSDGGDVLARTVVEPAPCNAAPAGPVR
ncbi:hypothetical protein [Luteimonas sp. A501]